jgi:hypothetical protein
MTDAEQPNWAIRTNAESRANPRPPFASVIRLPSS